MLVYSLPTYAIITNGENATNTIGQYDETSLTAPVPAYTKSSANNVPNRLGFDISGHVTAQLVDTVNHRYFIPDKDNNRVLVYNLNTDNSFSDRIPDNVLGQSNFYTNTTLTTQSGMRNPRGVAYDHVNQRLFVADTLNYRILVFDVTAITDGENAVNVLGQANFTASSSATTQSGFNLPIDIDYNTSTGQLFVTDFSNNRVVIYDASSITDGENAANVLGQVNFTSSTAATTQAGMSGPNGVVYDRTGQRLFVSQQTSQRVTVYDISSITDGENAVNVLGQANFTSSGSTTTQSGVSAPKGMAFDQANQRLFVADFGNNRVVVYDVTSISDGENYVNVLGQTTSTVSTAATTQSGLSGPQNVEYVSSSQRLYVSDNTNNRIMIFDVTAISDGENAVDLVGQYDETSFTDPVPVYTKATENNAPNRSGFNFGATSASTVLLDHTNHRLFVTDRGNNRVLVYNLNTDNTFPDRIPDNVLGQANFYSNTAASSQGGMRTPLGLAYDSVGNRLFVAEFSNNRVLVFDVTTITDGENATNVLGQSSFTASSTATTQSGMSGPLGLVYATSSQRLFVGDFTNNRVLVFDVASITDGENAINVLGQTVFTSSTSSTLQNGLRLPQDLAYDPNLQRLYVPESSNNRVLVFDVASISDGENAVNVLGQSSFTASSTATTQGGMSAPRGAAFDVLGQRLFVADTTNNRVLVFDVASITDGENATHVVGQQDFITATAATTQTGLNTPRGMSYDPTNALLYVQESGNNRVSVFDMSLFTISGTVYTDEGTTNIGAGKVVKLLVNGVGAMTATTTSSGVYTFMTSTPASGDILTVFLDGATEDGVTVTRFNSSTITGLNIYQDHLIVRSEDSTALSSANLNTANDGDTDITAIYSDGASPVVTSSKELFIWAGETFTPGATLDIDGHLEIGSSATLNAAANAITLAGNFTNSGTFTHTGTLTLDGVSQTITGTTTFATLSKSDATDDSTDVTLTLSNDITITTAVILDGLDATDRLNLVSSVAGTVRSIDFFGESTFTGDYLDITDNRIGDSSLGLVAPLDPANSVDGGNTSGWFAVAATPTPTPSSGGNSGHRFITSPAPTPAPTPPPTGLTPTSTSVPIVDEESTPSSNVTPTDTGSSVIPAAPDQSEQVENLSTFSNTFVKDIGISNKNDSDEVIKLQQFLNQYEGESLMVDGIYDAADVEAVKRFQSKHSKQVLDIWGLSKPTGYVGMTTRLRMNFMLGTGRADCPVFTMYNSRTVNNTGSEVSKTQEVLRGLGFYRGPVNAMFDTATYQAVVAFQEKFAAVMLAPWGNTRGTGYKYKTTNKFLNYLMGCDTVAVNLEGRGLFDY